MKNAALTAMLMMTTLGVVARAQSIPMSDPLSQQIFKKTPQQNGGVTAAVRAGSGQVVVLRLADVSSTFGAVLAPAASAPTALKPAAGLAAKTAKPAKAGRQPRRAVDQLHRITRAHVKNW